MRDALQGVLLAWAAVELALRVRHRTARRGPPSSDWSFPVVIVCVGGGIALAYRAAHVGPMIWGEGWTSFAVGISLLVAGVSFRAWAIATLGRFFTPKVAIQEGHRVVEDGPYRFIRHPSYTGGLVALLGVGVALGKWLSVLAVLLLPLAGILVRIHVEEKALLRGLGDEYREYAVRRRRLVPGVW